MIPTTQIKNKQEMITVPSEIMRAIFEELHLLRNEVMLLFPQEDLDEYVHPDRIKNSYQNAIKQYPPVSL